MNLPIHKSLFAQPSLHSQIYKTTTWRHFNDSTQHEAYYTASKANPGTLYCIFLQWPTDDLIGKPFTLISFVKSLIVVFCNAKKVGLKETRVFL